MAVILAALNLVATFFVNDDENDDNRPGDGQDTKQWTAEGASNLNLWDTRQALRILK